MLFDRGINIFDFVLYVLLVGQCTEGMSAGHCSHQLVTLRDQRVLFAIKFRILQHVCFPDSVICNAVMDNPNG